ncbi:PAS domain-containing protein [Sphingobacterium sp. WM]|uniref:PAS domain-containing protein n=1 Tax=Sphingobacterium sp. WM TaxID=3031802 RepID=UPI00240E317F|nr:PAS domain-containing protein [Sphingobacterium sp. WM]WFB64931.1 PAS domain-containing protein [Sphingobacterium sp. WM]
MKIQNAEDEINSLKRRLKDYDQLISSIDDIIFEIDQDGRILNCWTSTPEELFFEKENFINKTIEELFPEEFYRSIFYILNKSFSKRKGYSLKYRSPFKIESEQWYRLKTRIIDDVSDRLLIIITNITRDQRLFSNIQIKEEKFNRAFKNSSIGMLLLSSKLKVIEYNQELQDMLGYPEAEEMLEKKLTSFIDPDHLEYVKTAMEEVKDGIKEKTIIEASCIGKDDRPICCLINISSIRDVSGKLIYFLCQIQDLSLFKNNEIKLNQQNILLEKRNYELKVKVNQLEAYNQILTHNLRTPISNIEMIIGQLIEETDPKEKEILIKYLKQSNTKFLNLFDRLIESLEIQNSNDSLFQISNMEEICQHLLLHFQSKIESKKLVIACDFEVKEIAFPAIYFYNIILYLISESLKGVQSNKEIAIKITTKIVNNNIQLIVKNNCESIRCFGIERELESNDLEVDENTLLDLHMAKQQIQNFGGNILISRDVEYGNEIIITLPITIKAE